ncbi:MAG TPA: Holliday junction resolvase RuvX [Perlabentimonas sp.]|nr:Holliday junction resolvase RuvX [Perlabentimonas sp.]
MGRILSLDIGRKRTGVAATDPLKIIANGITTVPTGQIFDFITEYQESNDIEVIVIGMPKQMNNEPSEAVKYIKPVINRLKKLFPNIPLVMVDERFTSKIAHQTMIDGGVKKMDRRNKALVDTISATIILQSYLESLDYKNSLEK